MATFNFVMNPPSTLSNMRYTVQFHYKDSNHSQLFPGRGYLQRDGRCSASHQEYELCSQRGSHPHFYQRLSRLLPIFLLLQTLKGKKCRSLMDFWHVPKIVLEKSAFHIPMTITYVSVYQDHNFWLKTVAKRTQ